MAKLIPPSGEHESAPGHDGEGVGDVNNVFDNMSRGKNDGILSNSRNDSSK